jgi:hypothetical protein
MYCERVLEVCGVGRGVGVVDKVVWVWKVVVMLGMLRVVLVEGCWAVSCGR